MECARATPAGLQVQAHLSVYVLAPGQRTGTKGYGEHGGTQEVRDP